MADWAHEVFTPRDLRTSLHVPQAAPVQVVKACNCYDYQSNEHPEWEGSFAQALSEMIRGEAIAALPGYDSAAWGIDEGDFPPPVPFAHVAKVIVFNSGRPSANGRN
jgi:hypothetical protein